MLFRSGLKMHTQEATLATKSALGHQGLITGAKAMAVSAWRLANTPALLNAARNDLAWWRDSVIVRQ